MECYNIYFNKLFEISVADKDPGISVALLWQET